MYHSSHRAPSLTPQKPCPSTQKTQSYTLKTLQHSSHGPHHSPQKISLTHSPILTSQALHHSLYRPPITLRKILITHITEPHHLPHRPLHHITSVIPMTPHRTPMIRCTGPRSTNLTELESHLWHQITHTTVPIPYSTYPWSLTP